MLRTLAFRALLPFAAALGATVASIASASAPGAQAPDLCSKWPSRVELIDSHTTSCAPHSACRPCMFFES